MVLDIVLSSTDHHVLGFVTKEPVKEFCGFPVLGDDSILPKYKENVKLAIGIGGFTSNKLRRTVFDSLTASGYEIVNLIHHSAIVPSSVFMGVGNVIFAGVVINPEVQIGSDNVICTSSSIDHETVIDDHTLISAGVTIGGYTHIQDEVLIAIGATVVSGVTITSKTLVGAGAVVIKSIEDPGVYIGSPAKLLRPLS